MAVPNWAVAYLLARNSSDPAVAAVTLSHPRWGEPKRLVANTQDITSRGDVYRSAYFVLDVVTDTESPPRATMTIPNVDREIGAAIMLLSSPAEVAIEVLALSHLDEPLYRAARLELRNPQINAIQVSGDLVGHDYSTENMGTLRITPGRFPAYFRGR